MPDPSSKTNSVEVSRGWFPETRWSIVLTAQSEAGESERATEALSELCQIYWRPVYRFMRTSRSPEDAKDLTQEFFASLLSHEAFHNVAREKGKLRTFLLVSAKRFLINDSKKLNTQKRGGGVRAISIDVDQDEEALTPVELTDHLTPDIYFERQWAMTMLENVLSRLEGEYAQSDRADIFSVTKEYLTVDSGQTPYREIGERLKLTEGALRIAVFRMRRRYRELLHREIAQTVSSPDAVDDEIHHLLSVFSNSRSSPA